MSVWRRITLAVLVALILLCLTPLFFYLWANWVAGQNGCEFGLEMYELGCWVDGKNLAPVLGRAYGFLGLLVITLPVAFVATLIALAILGRRSKT